MCLKIINVSVFSIILSCIQACSVSVPKNGLARNLSSFENSVDSKSDKTEKNDFEWHLKETYTSANEGLTVKKYEKNVYGVVYKQFTVTQKGKPLNKQIYDEVSVSGQGVFLIYRDLQPIWSKKKAKPVLDYYDQSGELVISAPLLANMFLDKSDIKFHDFNELGFAAISFLSTETREGTLIVFDREKNIRYNFPYAKVLSEIPNLAIVGIKTGQKKNYYFKLKYDEMIFGLFDTKSNVTVLEPRFTEVNFLNKTDLNVINVRGTKIEKGVIRIHQKPLSIDVIVAPALHDEANLLNIGKCYLVTRNANSKCGIRDKDGKEVIPSIYSFSPFAAEDMKENFEKIKDYFPLIEGLIPVENDFHWGVMMANERTCQIVLEPIYNQINLWKCPEDNILTGVRVMESRVVERKLISSSRGKLSDDMTFVDRKKCSKVMEFPYFSFGEK